MGQTPPLVDTPSGRHPTADTPWQTPPPADIPLWQTPPSGRHHLGRHPLPPQADILWQTPRYQRPLQWTVRILLECILVCNNSANFHEHNNNCVNGFACLLLVFFQQSRPQIRLHNCRPYVRHFESFLGSFLNKQRYFILIHLTNFFVTFPLSLWTNILLIYLFFFNQNDIYSLQSKPWINSMFENVKDK